MQPNGAMWYYKMMLEHNIIDQSLYQMLSQRPLGVQSQRPVQQAQPGFMQAVRHELTDLLGNKSSIFIRRQNFHYA